MNNSDREKILFIQGFDNENSKKISEKYPNVIVFSEPEKPDDLDIDIYIKHIYTNGISYTPIQGINPNNNIILDDNKISLSINDNYLSLNKEPLTNIINERYFYIGSNIFEDLSSDSFEDLQLYSLDNTFSYPYNGTSNILIIIPVEWENHLKFSFNDKVKTIFEFTIDEIEQIKRNIILKDDCKYNIYKMNLNNLETNKITITKTD